MELFMDQDEAEVAARGTPEAKERLQKPEVREDSHSPAALKPGRLKPSTAAKGGDSTSVADENLPSREPMEAGMDIQGHTAALTAGIPIKDQAAMEHTDATVTRPPRPKQISEEVAFPAVGAAPVWKSVLVKRGRFTTHAPSVTTYKTQKYSK
ncbi:hypothetical protein HPB47_005382 [Ixodes persulcatus]|uniref:Uncharacterized protein n=1 Tax=Ixodes persulcatus TaxID=34615 RepID=A0AC60PDK2_IXOPE|nr:hypothetical protein HPB47_005382 [Ixodes persulcatus]